ncbi:MAG: ADP-forming succinate--CoA ligase subunit beta [Candidatus Omnitrophica bacterium]|nr:ADP-forming succinate--CoA ligase subunit beta [Candidatus Omnitrophota bacterium]
MKLHEYQAKQLFAACGLPIPRGIPATSPEEAGYAFEQLHVAIANVKAQLHAGGRGKAGGILVAHSAAEAARLAGQLLGQRLVTHQTGPAGLPVTAVLIEQRVEIARELYFAITVDRSAAQPVILASASGGMEIEELAATRPETMLREPVDLEAGPRPAQIERLVRQLQIPQPLEAAAAQLFTNAYQFWRTQDAVLVEINPLIMTPDQQLLVLDAKVVVDDNALFRHPALARLRDPAQEHPLELKAAQVGIAYVGLEGNIGCLVNGAGLAMATNDIITLHGGHPANFLDVGGGATVEQVRRAFQIILEDTRVTAILVNIFGGIMKCDVIAQGLLDATRGMRLTMPLVVRLEGTNVEQGRALLAKTELPLTAAADLDDAARRVVELAKR